jgi:hypothetical protein
MSGQLHATVVLTRGNFLVTEDSSVQGCDVVLSSVVVFDVSEVLRPDRGGLGPCSSRRQRSYGQTAERYLAALKMEG